MNRHRAPVRSLANRPRAPSPPVDNSSYSEEESEEAEFVYNSENAYSVVQDSMLSVQHRATSSRPPPMPPKKRMETAIKTKTNNRMFGDSVNPSPASSVAGTSSSSSSGGSSPTTTGIYQKRSATTTRRINSSSNIASSHSSSSKTMAAPAAASNKYDSATVEEIKAQFQKQIATMLHSQERNGHNTTISSATVASAAKSPPVVAAISAGLGVRTSHMQTTSEKELSDIRDLPRGKSFHEARTAVQRQIERMFTEAAGASSGGGGVGNPATKEAASIIKHTMHGVSHQSLEDNDDDIKPPPPMHYGVNKAMRQAAKSGGSKTDQILSSSSKWQSVESLMQQSTTTSESSKGDSSGGVSRNRSNDRAAPKPSKFRSMENVRSGGGGLTRTVVDVHNTNHNDADVTDRLRKFKMENGKSTPNLSSSNAASNSSAVSSTSSSSGDSSASSSFHSSVSKTASLSSSQPRPEMAKREFIKHKVDYLGALPISNRSTNLSALQRPLKDLYFRYKEQRNVGQSNLPGTMEINDTGLRVQYIREMHKGVQELFNPFATIAVWAAVKFVHKRDVVPMDGSVRHRFAFLPLISDPDSQDKHKLFHDLDFHEVELAADAPHPPIFACVMRRTGAPKQLECHGFVCASAEDAIIVAANLYQALLVTMKKQKARKQQIMQKQQQQEYLDAAPPPPSIFSDSDATASSATHPVRPPRKKKKSSKPGDVGYSGPSSLGALQRRRSVRSSIRSNKSKRTVTYDPTRRSTRLGRSDSTRKSINRSELARKSARRSTRRRVEDGMPAYAQSNKSLMADQSTSKQGDLYTKVAMPRSKSFMNVSSQYNLQELFRELKEKEGVESIDDVLKKVITPNGISFNEIKPVYRELLLKLAMTMSQDEIFQRSKNIMAQEKKNRKEEKKSSKKDGSMTENSSSNTLSSFLKMKFSSSKNNSMSSKKDKKSDTMSSLQSKKSNAILNPVNSYSLQSPVNTSQMSQHSTLVSTSTMASSSSSSARNKRTALTKADISGPLPINGTTKPQFTSRTPAATSKKVSSSSSPPSSVDDAYVSCSECGYESVCTYDTNCSCRVPKIPPPKEYQAGPVYSPTNGPFATTPPSSPESGLDQDIYCECDADSCVSTEKCYCSMRGHPDDHPHSKRPSVAPPLSKTGTLPKPGSSRVHVHHVHPHPVPPPPPPVLRGKNNTTIIHCNGSTSSSACSSCICDSNDDSGSTATDTTCYSIQQTHYAPAAAASQNQDTSPLSGFESPQTAWRRNSRLAAPPPPPPPRSESYSCSDCGDSALSRKGSGGSGGSGYQSNDSGGACPHHGKEHLQHQHRSRSHDVAAAAAVNSSHSSHSSSCASCNARGRPNRNGSKVLMLSAVDKAGKVVYHGASTSNLDRIHQQQHSHGAAGGGGGGGGNNSHLLTPPKHTPPRPPSSSKYEEDKSGGILSAKKSAEIAAVFSGAKINQTTDIVGVSERDSDEDSTDAAYDTKRNCHCGAAVDKSQFSKANMHSSLGYFP